jgi:hypothetical protein
VQHRLDAVCFDDGQAAAADGVNQAVGMCVADVFPGAKVLLERREGAVGVDVRGVLR